MLKTSLCFAALAMLSASACASPQPAKAPAFAPDAYIKVAEGPCYFRCPQFEIVVRPDGSYSLNNIAGTRKDGKSEGKFAPDVWPKAVAAFEDAKFGKMKDRTGGDGGEPCMTDAPFMTMARHFAPGDEKSVRWYLGCSSKPHAALAEKLFTLFQVKALVEPDA